MSDFPEQAKWLTEEERAYVKARLHVDQGRSALERKITLKDVGRVFKDYKIIVGGFMYFGLIVPAYGYAYFAPLIIKTYGYSPIQTQLHSVPPWAAAFGLSMVIAYLSDRTRHRFAFAILPICISIAGFAILLGAYGHTNVSYGALHLITSGTYSAMPIIVCWFTMNLGGHHRRAVGTGWQIGFGNIGGIIAVSPRPQLRHLSMLYRSLILKTGIFLPNERLPPLHSGIQHLHCLFDTQRSRLYGVFLLRCAPESSQGEISQRSESHRGPKGRNG